MAPRPARLGAVVAAVLALAGCGAGRQEGPETVRVALDFTPNAAHAGIYGATQGRRDRARGVRLEIRQPSASTDALKLLTTRRADLAVLDIHDLGLARERGEDLVGVGGLVQRPLAAVIAGAGASRPRELEGKRVGVTGLPSDDAVLRSVVQGDGGRFARVRRITIGFTAVPSLVAGKVAAATAFWSVEGVALRARGVRTHEFRVDDFGAPRYPELVVVATRRELDAHRDRIARVLRALADGTRAALRDPAPVVRAIARAGQADERLVRAELVAVRPALTPPLALESRALHGWAAFDVRFGILRRPPDLGRAFDTTLAP